MVKNRLREIRYKEYQMNQREFADFLGVEYNQYSLYDNNKYNPSLETALIISEKLNKHVDDIFYIV